MTKNLEGLKIALCQMKVVPGSPSINTAYIIDEIEKAAKRGTDIIIFPEMCTTGYFIGDLFEDEAFVNDVQYLNRQIQKATKAGITAIVGTLVSVPGEQGENGYLRKINAGVIYTNGQYIGHVAKTLQPNYRMFDDDRHFFSTRKIALEEGKEVEELLNPFDIKLKNGRTIRLGLILCEDMWHDSYAINPTEILVSKGAEIVVNLSASPWGWQKNRKRHQIVKKLLEECRVPFVYVNNTGTQNQGKNTMIFDGCSTVYNPSGDIVYQVSPYAQGAHEVELKEKMDIVPEETQNDTRELYLALRSGIKGFFDNLPPQKRKVIIGLSGGIDSSVSAALFTDILGPENVTGINMPSKFNSEKTKSLAKTLAENLGITYEVRPIQKIADEIAQQSSVKEGGLAYENIQARARMEILAARAQETNCVFSANWNKVEAAFGYGTLYGDMAGALAPLGDLLKREVYQIGEYLNREVFKREVIPQECFEIAPSAELSENQKDPFDYGRLDNRGYHEEMVRAFTEFRHSPEWFLDLYLKGELEKELKLEEGRLKRLFPTARHFVRDLEKHWLMYNPAYFKRLQGPPTMVVSKRAFGTDLRESLMAPYFTTRYFELKSKILSNEPPRIAIYGLSANPPALNHRQVVLKLLEWFNEVVVVPCGDRPTKDSLENTPPEARKEMVLLNFADLPGVTIDTHDLDNDVFTPTFALDEKYKKMLPDKEIWHAVGGDIMVGGKSGESEIQIKWQKGQEVWNNLNFTVVPRPGFKISPQDLPPHSELVEAETLIGSSTSIREMIAKGEDPKFSLKPEVYEYIMKNGLYKEV